MRRLLFGQQVPDRPSRNRPAGTVVRGKVYGPPIGSNPEVASMPTVVLVSRNR